MSDSRRSRAKPGEPGGAVGSHANNPWIGADHAPVGRYGRFGAPSKAGEGRAQSAGGHAISHFVA